MSSESWLSRKLHAINKHTEVPAHHHNNDARNELTQGVKSIAHSIANSVRSRAHSPHIVASVGEGSSNSSNCLEHENQGIVYHVEPQPEEAVSITAPRNEEHVKNNPELSLGAIPARVTALSPTQSILRPRPNNLTHAHSNSTNSSAGLVRIAITGNNDHQPHDNATTLFALESPRQIITGVPPTRHSTRRKQAIELPLISASTAKPSESLELPDALATPESCTLQPTHSVSGHNSSAFPFAREGSVLSRHPKKLFASTPIASPARLNDYFQRKTSADPGVIMVRKIWVKRPSASATLVVIKEDDLVDDVRDMILKKYANSLGRNFDSPDVALRICPREEARPERQLGPEEHMCQTIDAYYPGGQTVDEALVIDVPLRRTPKPSPRGPPAYYTDDMRPMEAGGDYFPPMPVPAQSPGAHLVPSLPLNGGAHHPALTQHAISVLTTGQVPPLPSPGSMRRGYTTQVTRPAPRRLHTSSPAAVNAVNATGTQLIPTHNIRTRAHSNASEKSNPPSQPPAPPPLPTPPVPEVRAPTPPPVRPSSPSVKRVKKTPKYKADHPSLPAGVLNGAVPPINVLIVEDNIINLKLLEAFMKRLKVRWQTAMDGRQAVNKWRAGGFHLVLMDIQLPVMSGLEATREIRRLEKLNNIGVFSSSASSSAPEERSQPDEEDKLPTDAIFKSPVIIVALTASSLQSDRHEALAAGCNDFLTKVCFLLMKARQSLTVLCSLSTLCGSSVRLWNGDACKR